MEGKFRVWDFKIGKFVEDRKFFYADEDGTLFEADQSNEVVRIGKFCTKQYSTGLRDVNDKEIYDGDLIKGDGYGPHRVFWEKGSWCSSCYCDSEPISRYRKIEVVGHIYDGTKYEGRQ